MAVVKQTGWGETGFYEILCLMMVGVCCWMIGTQFGAFNIVDRAIEQYDLSNFALLAMCIGCGAGIGSIRKSLQLRQARSDRDRARKEARTIARCDHLTGLPNRLMLIEAVTASKNACDGGAVLLIDLDRFKPINDLYGHAAGDQVLKTVADRLRKLVQHPHLTARIGGDEFCVLMLEDIGGPTATHLAETIIAAIAEPIEWNDVNVSVGATIGVARISDEEDAEAILHAADLALDHAKKDHRGGFRQYASAMSEDLKSRALRERELRDAIDLGQIAPFYQPVVSLTTRALIGFEVLARWHHPRLGLLPPGDFIEIAEQTGMIADLSYLLLRQACKDASHWPEHLQLAVNISPQQFEDPQLASKILAVLTETGFRPDRLEVEITESAIVKDIDATRKTLAALQTVGVRIALDDFGTGYSSLYHLRELRFDKLKIDRSYVNTIAESDDRARLVDAIIKLGTSLGLVTTAEGIECDSSVEWLESQGCDYGQGFLFGKPLSKERTDRLFSAGMLPMHVGEPVVVPTETTMTQAA